jgi:hypothetical protein
MEIVINFPLETANSTDKPSFKYCMLYAVASALKQLHDFGIAHGGLFKAELIDPNRFILPFDFCPAVECAAPERGRPTPNSDV